MFWRRCFGELPLRERGLALLSFSAAVLGSLLLMRIVGAVCSIPFSNHELRMEAVSSLLTTPTLMGLYAFLSIALDRKLEFEAADIGFPRTAARRLSAQGLALGGAMILACYVAIRLGASDVATHFSISGRSLSALLVVFFWLLSAAANEELLFRGYPFQKLTQAFGPVGAILALSALFGAMHFDNPHNSGLFSWEFFNTLAVGVLFAFAVLRSGSLWLPIGLHFAWNFTLGALLGLPVSGIGRFAVVTRSHVVGPRLLTGGDYGVEASLTGAVVILAAFPVVWLLTRRRAEAIPAVVADAEEPQS